MAEISLERVTAQAKALTTDQQRQLRALLDSWLTPTVDEEMQERERQFVADMVSKGVLTNVPTGKRLYPDPKPIIVHGEPVSETIIRERR